MSERLRRARDDLGTFAALVERPLTAWQAASLRLERAITAIVAPRQGGKSRSLAVLALHRAYRQAGYRVLVVSAGEAAARRLLAEVREVAAGSPLLSGSVVDEQAALVTLSNGSEIRSVPASQGQIRGWTVDLLLVDEAGWVEDELILGAALPTTAARPDARIVLASSAGEADGTFYDHVVKGESDSEDAEHIAVFRWLLADCTWISPASIAAARASMPAALFEAEYEGVFAESLEGALLEPAWIEAAQRRSIVPVIAVGLGADIARSGGDETVVMRAEGVESTGWRVRLAQLEPGRPASWRGADLVVTTDRLAGLVTAAGEGAVMVVDSVGLGQGPFDALRARGLPVLAFSGGERAQLPGRFGNRRAESAWRMRDLFEAGQLDLDPRDALLARQLRSLRWRADGRDRILIESKDSMRSRGVASPDRADALVMALEAVREAAPAVTTKDDEIREWARRIEAERYWEQLGCTRDDAELFARQGSLTADLLGEAM